MRYRIRRHPASATLFSPPSSHRLTASRHASRLTVSPDGSAQGTTPSYLLPASLRLACLLISSPSHRLIRFTRCLLRSDPCGGSSSHPSHRLIAHAPSDDTSGEQAKRRTGRAIDDGVRRTLRHPTSRRQRKMPLPARRIAPTSRMTHKHSTNTPTGKRPLHEPHNAPDGQYGTTNGTRQRDASACRHDDETIRRNAACLLPDTTTKRPTPRRTATRLPTRRNGTKCRDDGGGKQDGMSDGTESGTKKKRAAIRKEKRLEKRNEV